MDETALLSERTLFTPENSLHLDCVLCTTILRVGVTKIHVAGATHHPHNVASLFVRWNRVHIWPQCRRLFAAPPPGDLNSPKMQIPIAQRSFYENFA